MTKQDQDLKFGDLVHLVHFPDHHMVVAKLPEPRKMDEFGRTLSSPVDLDPGTVLCVWPGANGGPIHSNVLFTSLLRRVVDPSESA